MKETVIKKLLTGPKALTALAIIYPYISFLAVWMNNNLNWQEVETDWVESCGTFPVEIVTYSVTALIALQIITVLPVWFGRVKDAIYIQLISLLSITGIGSWFFLTAYVYLLCKPLNNSNTIFLVSVILFLVLSVVTFIFYWKPRLDKVINLNNDIFDFNQMKFYILKPMKRLDGKDSRNVALVVSGAAIGAVISARIHDYTADGIEFFILMFFIGYAFIGVGTLTGIYIISVIFRKNQETGKKMQIAELCE